MKKKMNMHKSILLLAALFFMASCSKTAADRTSNAANTKPAPTQTKPDSERWQMAIKYVMDIDVDAEKHQYKGNQTVYLTNNSPDYLNKVFYHLYFNAFQPGSVMDVRSSWIQDPDGRVKSRIGKLTEDEIGYIKVKSLTMDGKPVSFEHVGTILEVDLTDAIAPGKTVKLEMVYDAQVPIQIRRSGRDNAEGIEFSMSQWYPKVCNYDYQGWHANPYVGREFYGIWGDFDVKIHIDSKYIVAATGTLMNAKEIRYGYAKNPPMMKEGKLTYHYVGKKIHDFVWAADPDYKHTTLDTKDGITMHFYYQENEKTKDNWEALPKVMSEAFNYINENFGQYPYKSYAFIQGGDGGMEYPMATLITGERNFGSLVGVSVHELLHSWYQMILGTNEALHPWMDEGFTSYASARTMNHLTKERLVPGMIVDNPSANATMGYANFAKTGYEEPLSTHSDHYQTNQAYGVGSYVKGAVFLSQLEYVIGKEAFDKGMLNYFHTWKFKSPNPNDFIRVMEKTANLELDWYKEYFVFTTHTIDYAVDNVQFDPKGSTIFLKRIGLMPMPVDVTITTTDGQKIEYNIPLAIMRGNKKLSAGQKLADDWSWTNINYSLKTNIEYDMIKSVEIDPSFRMADTDRRNNKWEPAAK